MVWYYLCALIVKLHDETCEGHDVEVIFNKCYYVEVIFGRYLWCRGHFRQVLWYSGHFRQLFFQITKIPLICQNRIHLKTSQYIAFGFGYIPLHSDKSHLNFKNITQYFDTSCTSRYIASLFQIPQSISWYVIYVPIHSVKWCIQKWERLRIFIIFSNDGEKN